MSHPSVPSVPHECPKCPKRNLECPKCPIRVSQVSHTSYRVSQVSQNVTRYTQSFMASSQVDGLIGRPTHARADTRAWSSENDNLSVIQSIERRLPTCDLRGATFFHCQVATFVVSGPQLNGAIKLEYRPSAERKHSFVS